jgi:hypothetical protein
MTPAKFRKLALALPEAVESSHMGHPDFRVGGKIFATLSGPGHSRAMVKLTEDQQHALTRSMPDVFTAVPGGWGRQGATYVGLPKADAAAVSDALQMAWRNTAPKKLLSLHPTTRRGRKTRK